MGRIHPSKIITMKRSIPFFVVLLLISFAASAQKLPNIQEASVRAPGAMRVDGKATEWNNQFQAYNKATEIYYTVSNDKDKLYLTIQATDLDIINKIICGGLTFMINGSGKTKDQDGKAITFPALKRDNYGGGVGAGAKPINHPPIDYKADATLMNDQFMGLSKDIKVTGIEGIKDSISIYNPEGIKAVARFNEEKIFTCEIAMPLKYLNLPGNAKSLIYSIKIDGPLIRNLTRRGLTSLREINGVLIMEGPDAPRIQSLIAPTNFWGEYTLAK